MSAISGKVFFVGAGPGDPKLITVRGVEAISAADVVVYDRLASPRLLRYMKPGASKIYVGKLPDRHTLQQDEINRLLLDLALQGKVVTRLKGGDPAVFGRVGEEALVLAEHGIPFEWVPGVSSAIAVPAYAGIPVTHRGITSSFAVVTGHECPQKEESDIDWAKLATATGTVIFLMGVKNLAQICEQLMAFGRSPGTPVAVIRWGTCSEQQTVTGTLQSIHEQVLKARLTSPAITIVGEVVTLREQLSWFETKPLFGRKIVVTRARTQASQLVAAIEELGGEALEFPLIETVPIVAEAERAAIEAELPRLEQFDWIVFTSVNGVGYFFAELLANGTDVRNLKGKIAAVGEKTADALRQRGLLADLVPEPFRAEALENHFASAVSSQPLRFLLVRAKVAEPLLPARLRAAGHEVSEIAVYETESHVPDDEYVLEQLRSGAVDVITFTSSSTVHGFVRAMQPHGLSVPESCKVICIGPVTAEAAREAGLSVTAVAEQATIESLVRSILQEKE